jgi:hypothetical protein
MEPPNTDRELHVLYRKFSENPLEELIFPENIEKHPDYISLLHLKAQVKYKKGE